MKWKNVSWVGLPDEEIRKRNILQGDTNGRFAYYRFSFEAKKEDSLNIRITANSRYRLWINETSVLSGPCKGDQFRHYYEEVDLSKYLISGINIIAVQVLLCDGNASAIQESKRHSILSVASIPAGHRLAVEGQVKKKSGEAGAVITTGKVKWKVLLDSTFYLESQDATIYLGAICEKIDFRKSYPNWKKKSYDDSEWETACSIETVLPSEIEKTVGWLKRFLIQPREIPLLFEEKDEFLYELGNMDILNGKSIVVDKNKNVEFVLDAGAVTNAYMNYAFSGGEDSKISFTYFEKYTHPNMVIKRNDAKRGNISGLKDEIIIGKDNLNYEPFWYRTFRFVRIEIETAKEKLYMKLPQMKKTGFPLNIQTQIHSSEEWVEQVWQMCCRTLQNCMMETYMDCPYYEQMQFIMDTRLQALFTYVVSEDTSLVRKALQDFHCSITPEGLMHGKYPSAYPQIITTFSLYFIFMLLEYYEQTQEREIIKKYRPDVDSILGYYDSKIGSCDLVENLEYWAFVDWQEEWKETGGVPAATMAGPSTIINLMYAYALKCGAKLNQASGRSGIAQEYLERHNKIVNQIQKLCWDDAEKMYKEGPKFQQFSQHAQAWAVVNGLKKGEEGRNLLKKSMENSNVIPCSFSTSYELFRALEMTGAYKETNILMNKWIELIDLGCMTCPEEPGQTRSDCHAWSALPMFELVRCTAGIGMGEDGWKSIVIQPYMDELSDISGSVLVPGGKVLFSYQQLGETTEYKINLQVDKKATFIYPDGREIQLKKGENIIN